MKITLLQWNVWTKEKPEKVVSLIRSVDPDIACLQELTIRPKSSGLLDVPEFLANELEYKHHYITAHEWQTDAGPKKQGNGIFSRFAIENKRHKFVQVPSKEISRDYSDEGRVLVKGDILLDKKRITVVTTHLSYTDRFVENEKKLTEEENLIRELKTIKGKLIFAGDLNTTENSYLVRQLDPLMVSAGPDYGNKTWTTKPFEYMGFVEDKLAWRFDYVFVSKDIKVLKSKIIDTNFSDHLPILVEVEI